MAVGIPLGIVMGVVSGTAFILFLKAAFGNETLKAAGHLLALPTSWFGGGWLTEVFDLDEILSWYVALLAVSFLIVGGYPLFQAIVRIGNGIGTAE